MTQPTVAASKSLPRRQQSESSESESRASNGGGIAFSWWLIGSLLTVGLAILFFSMRSGRRGAAEVPSPSRSAIPQQYSAERSMAYLRQLCELGPRPSGSDAMQRQQRLLETFFQERGAQVTRQTFETRHPEDGSAVPMTNLIASWHPTRPRRFLFCAHYDTRPYPDRDPHNKRGRFVGANDGASGTAALMELANQLGSLPDDIGIDLVLFDGEEFVWQERRDRYFIGSTYFAEQYKHSPPRVPYQAGVLFDMVGDKELRFYYEINSIRYAKSVARSFWKQAEDLGVRAFVQRTRHELRDDHLPLNQIAKIPTIDVIDFDYPRPGIGTVSYWHTMQDVPENCSGESIAAVVWVAHRWILSQSAQSKPVR